jgi:RNA polymerase sigma factor (sigma-70 family)
MENFELFSEYSITKDKKLRDTIFLENQGLIHHTIRKYYGNAEFEYEEIYSLGCEGLLKAIDKYDVTRGAKFSTIAVLQMLNSITRGLKRYRKQTILNPLSLDEELSSDTKRKTTYVDLLDSGDSVEEEIEEKELTKVALELYNQQKMKLTTKAMTVADNYFLRGMTITESGLNANTNQSYASQIVKRLNSAIYNEFFNLM